jgi:predicted N-acetyltransferase YhbS
MSPHATLRPPAPADLPVISELHARAFGPGRFARTAYRVREGTPAISPYCLVAEMAGSIIAALRMTEVEIGGQGKALMLGPLAVDTPYEGQGHGRRLIRESLDLARTAGIEIVVLVGDEPYYGRLGFVRVPAGQITMPGPVDPARLLAAELSDGALGRYSGLVLGRLTF